MPGEALFGKREIKSVFDTGHKSKLTPAIVELLQHDLFVTFCKPSYILMIIESHRSGKVLQGNQQTGL